MHPLELQVKDLKETVTKKTNEAQACKVLLRSVREKLEEIRGMLHPSRQKNVDSLLGEIQEKLNS